MRSTNTVHTVQHREKKIKNYIYKTKVFLSIHNQRLALIKAPGLGLLLMVVLVLLLLLLLILILMMMMMMMKMRRSIILLRRGLIKHLLLLLLMSSSSSSMVVGHARAHDGARGLWRRRRR